MKISSLIQLTRGLNGGVKTTTYIKHDNKFFIASKPYYLRQHFELHLSLLYSCWKVGLELRGKLCSSEFLYWRRKITLFNKKKEENRNTFKLVLLDRYTYEWTVKRPKFYRIRRKDHTYGRTMNLLTCVGSSTLLTPPLCTVGWFARTEIYVLADQSICPVWKKHRHFWTISSFFFNPFELRCPIAEPHSLFYDCLQYILLFRPNTKLQGGKTDKHMDITT